MTSNTLWSDLAQRLETRREQSLYRQQACVEQAEGVYLIRDGKKLLNFCSNDYLSLADSPKLIAALQEAAAQHGVGGRASHLVCGHHQLHEKLEQELASLTKRDAALLLPSGFAANLSVLSALFNQQDVIFQDKLNHASLIDGCKLSGARLVRFAHNDMQHLEAKLKKSQEDNVRHRLIVVDGVFSMDGDLAPLKEIASLAKQYNATFMVDDAHGFGVLGDSGCGSLELLGLSQDDVPILMATFGKAVGVYGAFVAGPQVLIDALRQFARPYIYTTATPAMLSAATLASLEHIKTGDSRKKLRKLVEYFKAQASEANLPIMPSDTAIQPLLIGDEAQAIKWQQALLDQGFWINAIRTPTVPKGQARLRITLCAGHEVKHIDQLIAALSALQKSLGEN